MNYPAAYIDYLVHFHADRDYFECHEILEEHWKSELPEKRQAIWVGLIQIAVSLYHQRRENYNGAYRMMKSALRILHNEEEEIKKLGLDYDALVLSLHRRTGEIKHQTKYNSLFLPISDPSLTTLCKQRSEEKGLAWWSSSDAANTELVHRHKLRDRTSVIAERQKNLEHKQNARQ
ncbi:putative metal-dependent hydrolase [Bacillus fengqiuensis]|nr:putative metal-dependent hydrolase [Bacillus fengqiuensis]